MADGGQEDSSDVTPGCTAHRPERKRGENIKQELAPILAGCWGGKAGVNAHDYNWLQLIKAPLRPWSFTISSNREPSVADTWALLHSKSLAGDATE